MENKKSLSGFEWMSKIQGVLIIGLYMIVKATYIILTMVTPDSETAEILRPYRYLSCFLVAVVIALNVYIYVRIKKRRAELLQKLT